MAHLPPKIPNIAPNWQDFAQQKISSASPFFFHGFSSARRALHRRSVSDSIAFVEKSMSQSLLGSAGPSNNVLDGFDDGEQFRSMLSDEIPPDDEDDQPTSSDHNGDEKDATAANDDPKHQMRNEPKEDVQSECNNNVATNVSNHRITDPKRVKR